MVFEEYDYEDPAVEKVNMEMAACHGECVRALVGPR